MYDETQRSSVPDSKVRYEYSYSSDEWKTELPASGNGSSPPSNADEAGSQPPPPPLHHTQKWSGAAVAVMATLMGAFIVVGVIGNLFVLLAIVTRRRGLKNKSNAFVLNLALTDLGTSAMSMPLALATLLHGRWIFGDWLCQLSAFTTELFFITSTHTLMYMSVYRYIGISRPLSRCRTRSWHVMLMLFGSWTYAAAISAITWQVLNHFLYKPHTTQCGPAFPSNLLEWIDVGLVAVTCFAIPIAVIVTMYGLIYIRIWQHLGRLQVSSNLAEQRAYAQQRHLAITFLIIVVAFLFCWTPLMVYIVYISVAVDKRPQAPALLNPVVYWLSYMNSAINPIVYSLRMPLFRHFVGRLFCLARPTTWWQQSQLPSEMPTTRYDHN